jgi:predicted DNA-binding transcriptional regulator AlpA
MSKRLITWRQIREGKINRGRTWIKARAAAGKFPKPVIEGSGSGGDLWDEEEVDHWIVTFIASARAGSVGTTSAHRVRNAAAARAKDERRFVHHTKA